MFKKCQDYRFFDIFLDISHKMKKNLDQEHVKRGLLIFQGKIRKIVPDFPGKNDSFFPVLTLLFHLSLPKIQLSHLHKNYLSEMSNNRAICWKSFIMLSFFKIVDLVAT